MQNFDQEQDNKNSKNKNNPFEIIEETISRKIASDHTDVFNNLHVQKKFIYAFFKNCETERVTNKSLEDILQIILLTVSYYFDLL